MRFFLQFRNCWWSWNMNIRILTYVKTFFCSIYRISFSYNYQRSRSQCGVWLTDWMTGLWFPVEVTDFFSSLCVQTGSEASPASYPMGTCGPFPGVKRGWGVTLTVHPRLVLRSRMSRCISSPPWRLRGGSGTTLALSYRQIHCPSVYVTISIFYCKWEHETEFWMIF
jgi:hypothetical protein